MKVFFRGLVLLLGVGLAVSLFGMWGNIDPMFYFVLLQYGWLCYLTFEK